MNALINKDIKKDMNKDVNKKMNENTGEDVKTNYNESNPETVKSGRIISKSIMLGVIGCGKMGSALLEIIRAKTLRKEDCLAYDHSAESLRRIKERFSINIAKDVKDLASRASIIIIAVKPADIDEVLNDIKYEAKGKLIISIAAGIRISHIESIIDARVIRVMPNTPAIVGSMAAGYSLGKNAGEEDAKMIEHILSPAGIMLRMDESSLDIVTALSGSGPAFFARFIIPLIEESVKSGLDRDIARKLAIQTCIGTGRLMIEKNISPEELISMVKSKGGTTEAGLDSLDDSSEQTFDSYVKGMIRSAFEKSKELGNKEG